MPSDKDKKRLVTEEERAAKEKRALKYLERVRKNYPLDEKYYVIWADYCAGNYNSFFSHLDTYYADEDMQRAKEAIKNDSTKGDRYIGAKGSRLLFSYIQTEKGLLQRKKAVGQGTFGKVRLAEKSLGDYSAVKRQSLTLMGFPKPSDKNYDTITTSLVTIAQNKLQRTQNSNEKNRMERWIKRKNFPAVFIEFLILDRLHFVDKDNKTVPLMIHRHPFDDSILKIVPKRPLPSEKQSELVRINTWLSTHNLDALYREYLSLPGLEYEAKINVTMKVATGPLIIRRNVDGSIYKVYQDMLYFKESLMDTVRKQENSTSLAKTAIAIDLLLSLQNMHDKGYAHCDIKPDNIRMDADGKPCFIDFGFSKKNTPKKMPHRASEGSYAYMPIPIDAYIIGDVSKKRSYFSEVIETPNYYFDDKIATLRTIYHPLKNIASLRSEVDSIYSQTDFEQLPQKLQDILNTAQINIHTYSVKAITAILIAYYNSPYTFDMINIDELANNEASQSELIASYQSKTNPPKDSLVTIDDTKPQEHLEDIARHSFISLLKEKHIFVKDLPERWKRDEALKEAFSRPETLQDLKTALHLDVTLQDLSNINTILSGNNVDSFLREVTPLNSKFLSTMMNHFALQASMNAKLIKTILNHKSVTSEMVRQFINDNPELFLEQITLDSGKLNDRHLLKKMQNSMDDLMPTAAVATSSAWFPWSQKAKEEKDNKISQSLFKLKLGIAKYESTSVEEQKNKYLGQIRKQFQELCQNVHIQRGYKVKTPKSAQNLREFLLVNKAVRELLDIKATDKEGIDKEIAIHALVKK